MTTKYKSLLVRVAVLGLLSVATCGAATTTVLQTIVGPSSAPSTGTVTIHINTPCTAADGQYVSLDSSVVNFSVNVPFSVSVEPNDTCIPAGTSYQVSYRVGSRTWNETWVVPTSALTLSISNVVTPVIPTPLLTVQLPQLAAGTASDGDYCLHVQAGKISATLVACAGGGGAIFSWSVLTNSNWSNVTSTQWPTLVF